MIGLPSRIDLLNAIAPRYGTSVVRGLAYGPDPRHLLDIYRPTRQRQALPVVVFFYGGAWQSGERSEYRFVGAALARLGLIVAIADYRLYPAVRYPAFIQDAARATAWIARDIDGYGGDPRAIFIAGHSAGAYLALMLALAPAYLAEAGYDRASLAGAIGLAGPYDFLPLTRPAYQKIFAPEPDLANTQPVTHADSSAPPCLLLTGAKDRRVSPANTAQLAERLRAAGATVDTRIYPGLGHTRILLSVLAWPGLSALVPADIAGFIARTLDSEARVDRLAQRRDMAGRANPG